MMEWTLYTLLVFSCAALLCSMMRTQQWRNTATAEKRRADKLEQNVARWQAAWYKTFQSKYQLLEELRKRTQNE